MHVARWLFLIMVCLWLQFVMDMTGEDSNIEDYEHDISCKNLEVDLQDAGCRICVKNFHLRVLLTIYVKKF